MAIVYLAKVTDSEKRGREAIGPAGNDLSSEGAIEYLARRLHWKMEHLDPSEDADWGGLSERQKEFYRLCVREVIRDGSMVDRARGSDKAVPVTTV